MKAMYEKMKAGFQSGVADVGRTLVAGDLLHVEGGNLTKADPSINYHDDMTAVSLKKLAEYDIDTVICYHGGVFRGNTNQRIAELAAGV